MDSTLAISPFPALARSAVFTGTGSESIATCSSTSTTAPLLSKTRFCCGHPPPSQPRNRFARSLLLPKSREWLHLGCGLPRCARPKQEDRNALSSFPVQRNLLRTAHTKRGWECPPAASLCSGSHRPCCPRSQNSEGRRANLCTATRRYSTRVQWRAHETWTIRTSDHLRIPHLSLTMTFVPLLPTRVNYASRVGFLVGFGALWWVARDEHRLSRFRPVFFAYFAAVLGPSLGFFFADRGLRLFGLTTHTPAGIAVAKFSQAFLTVIGVLTTAKLCGEPLASLTSEKVA